MDRKLINYLPEVLRNFREFQKTFEAEEPEVQKVYGELSKVLNDLFVEDATERGVKRWEKILKITPKASDSLDERKFRILTKLMKQLPYTMRRLEQLLDVLCEGDFEVNLQNNIYTIEIKINLTGRNNFNDINELVEIMLPANLIRELKSYLMIRSKNPKYGFGVMFGEEMTVYPWSITNVSSKGKKVIGIGYQVAETSIIYPKGDV